MIRIGFDPEETRSPMRTRHPGSTAGRPGRRSPPRLASVFIVLAAGIGFGADSAGAVSPEADTLSVEQCIALARSRAPDVLSTAALLAAARADSVAGGLN